MGKLTDSLKVRLKMVEGVGRLYWGEYGYIRKEDITSKSDWKSALELFIEHYAFERLSGFPLYSKAAVRAFREVAGKSKIPSPTITSDFWNKFKKILEELAAERKKKVKMNEKLNPLYPESSTWKKPLLHFISNMNAYDFNIILWAKALLSQGKAESGYENLECVRGISQKIGTFFLRDVSYAFDIPEGKIGDPTYIQPVDYWVRKAANILLGETSSDWRIAEEIANIASKCEINGALLNTGLWILGSEIAESGEYESALKSPKNLAACFKDYAEEAMHWSKEVRKLTRYWKEGNAKTRPVMVQ